MTQPPTIGGPPEPPGGWSQQPQYGPPPGQHGPPPGQHGPPPDPQWQAPGMQWQPPQYGQPGQSGQWEMLGGGPLAPIPDQPVKRRGRGRLIAAAVAVVALTGGGIATYVAVSDSNSHLGAAGPDEAVQMIVDDINNSDLLGVLDDLPPNERDALSAALLDDIKELKRIHVLTPSADASKVAGVTASIKGLTFVEPVRVNDHVQIAQLTGGTVSISAELSKLTFTSEFLDALFPDGPPTGTATTTGNVADAVRDNVGKPVRIATEKVDGRWYPSVFYTIADNAADDAGLHNPTSADLIAAKGAASPSDAVRQLVDALLAGDVRRAIELVSPTELAALHEYGGLILQSMGSSYPAVPVHLDDLQLITTSAARGAESVGLKSLRLTTDDGVFSLSIDGDCVEMALPGEHAQRLCSADLVDQIGDALTGFGADPLTAAQKRALTHLFSGSALSSGGGIITTQTDGQWYVNPVRTELDSVTTILTRLQGNDLIELIQLVQELSD